MYKMIIFPFMLLTGCASIEAKKFYVEYIAQKDFKSYGIQTQNDQNLPRIVHLSEHIDSPDDYHNNPSIMNLLSEGHLLIGEIHYHSTTKLDGEVLKNIAQEKGASIIAWSKSYLGSETSNVPFTTPTSKTTYHSGTVNSYGGGFANYSGSSTTYGTQTHYIPVTAHRNRYQALFFSKSDACKKAYLGVNFEDLTPALSKKYKRNTGAIVTVVCKGGLAYKNNIVHGDIITQIEGGNTLNSMDVSKSIKEQKIKNVKKFKITLIRDGKEVEKTIITQ